MATVMMMMNFQLANDEGVDVIVGMAKVACPFE
jgi:hypothetical protein